MERSLKTKDIFLRKIKILHFLYVYIFPACVLCTAFVPGAHGGQKMALGPLELNLQIVVSCHVSAAN